MSISDNEFVSDDAFSDNSDVLNMSDVDYLPISAEGAIDDDDDIPNYSHANGGGIIMNTSAVVSHDSGNHLFSDLNDVVSALDLNGDEEHEEEEEERAREREEALIQRAFMEDERRRSAPLTTETAVRVMEAMRGISYLGFPPDWAGRVSEDRWIGHLSRLRTTEDQSSASETSSSQCNEHLSDCCGKTENGGVSVANFACMRNEDGQLLSLVVELIIGGVFWENARRQVIFF